MNVDSTAEEIWKYREDLIVQSLPKPTDAYSGWSNLILNARQGLHDSTLPAGRSIDVYNKDVAAAFAKLRRTIIQNGVVKELRLAERHEKKGDKRRRLKSERWRRRFAYEVCPVLLLLRLSHEMSLVGEEEGAASERDSCSWIIGPLSLQCIFFVLLLQHFLVL